MANPAQRREGESYPDYRARLAAVQLVERSKQPNLLWPAMKGTYVQSKHGFLTEADRERSDVLTQRKLKRIALEQAKKAA